MRNWRWIGALALALCVGCQTDGDGDGSASDSGVDMEVPPACANGVDDDGDGETDLDDPGCTGGADDDESDDPPLCANERDDDGDGDTDLDDRGCADASDNDESDDPPFACGNGVDDDDDGAIDGEDRGCASPRDDDESDDPPLPACDNGEDDDGDGFTDFPADPGCGSRSDDDETDSVQPRPQCADFTDNDNDGRVDLADPGCSSPADPREQDPETPAACFNSLDDDGDGVADFPRDPGCSAAGDEDETDGPRPPLCGNGLDDDGDGAVDYPYDPGCAGVGDQDETDPEVVPGCADGVDNDGDGRVDFPVDPGCESANDGTERASCGARRFAVEIEDGRVIRGDTSGGVFDHEGSCGGRGAPEVAFLYRLDAPVEALEITTDFPETELETTLYVRRACATPDSELACAREPADETAANSLRLEEPAPGTYYIFLDGAANRGGAFAMRVDAIPLAECRNGVDDDGDGRRDYPDDPGCLEPFDRDEADPDPPPVCADDRDNDGDGLVDYPLDVGCAAASDTDEVDACGQGVAVRNFPAGAPFVDGTLEGGTNVMEGSCGGAGRAERIYRYVNPYNANLVFSVDNEFTDATVALYVRGDQCSNPRDELGCEAREPPPTAEGGTVVVERAGPGEYYVIVDTVLGIGDFRLTVTSERLPPGCADSFDNDEDGFVDADDIGCESPGDEGEDDPLVGPPPVCANGLDDDDDGLIDYPWDPGCLVRGAPSEDDPAVPPGCANGLDDDEDGLVDFPRDPGCAYAADEDEADLGRPACSNRVDDDGDDLIDWPYDPGCGGPGSRSEGDPPNPGACADEADNDRDGLVDFPFDPGCASAGWYTEVDPDVPFACGNRIDDDEDGIIDFPRDPGCQFAADDTEDDPNFAPACANGRDDDNNGRIDWPDDPGCESAADTQEMAGGRINARCADGLDNDDDGFLDLADPGCTGNRDDDESDPDEVPWCDDGIDNDEDGVTDWPDDDGCAARGDECEQPGYGLCDGQCLDLVADAQNCGQCGRVCDEGVECIDGFCGGLFVFEGILEDVAPDRLGGWEICHQDTYGESGTRIADVLAQCDGEYIMYGCKQNAAENWQLLAMGERDEVFRNTGDQGNQLNEHNGVAWYFSQSWSIGFVLPGTGVQRNSCDTANNSPEYRLCWHTGNTSFNGGYRCGARTGLNGARDWDRVIWTSR